MKTNDLPDIRRVFANWHGAPRNVVTDLCDEVEQLRAANAALARRVVDLAGELEHYRDQGLLESRSQILNPS